MKTVRNPQPGFKEMDVKRWNLFIETLFGDKAKEPIIVEVEPQQEGKDDGEDK